MHPKKVVVACLLVALAATQEGCGTLFNLREMGGGDMWPDPTQPSLRVYGGVRYDAEMISCIWQSSPPKNTLDLLSYYMWISTVVSYDMPLCLVADTATLPWTVEATIERLQGVPKGYGPRGNDLPYSLQTPGHASYEGKPIPEGMPIE